MAFVPGFEHDIFLSYAHVNNPGGEDGGWVKRFHQALQQELIQLTGKQLDLWRDRRLARNNDFDKTIKAAVESSALFLAINSHAYRQSPYCQDEIKWFHERAQQDGHGVSLGDDQDRRRMIHTLINSQPFTSWPTPFQGMMAYNFFEAVPDDDIGLPLEPDSPPFKNEFKTLVRELARTLLIFKDTVEKRRARPTPASLVKADPAAISVFLADTSESQQQIRERLVNELERESIQLAKALPPPYDSPAHDAEAATVLQHASLSVHLLDGWRGRKIDQAKNDYYPRRQLELARQHTTAPMIWVPRKLKLDELDDEEQRDYLRGLESAPRAAGDYGFMVYDAVDDIVREIVARQQKFAQQQTAANSEASALLDAHLRDMSHALECFDPRLSQRNVPLKTNWGNDDPRKNLDELARSLKAASHLILVFGQVPRDWVVSRLREAVKICVEDDFRIKPCGIYFAPPHKLDDGRFDFGTLPVMQFDSATLDQTLTQWLARP